MSMLDQVKTALGIYDIYHDNTLSLYIEEVMDFLEGAGVPKSRQTAGIVSRGVSDLWNYGAGDGTLSEYFKQRATQLALR